VSFSTQDFLVLDLVHREQRVPPELHEVLRHLIELGVLESIDRGRGTRYLLARRFYTLMGRRGSYTRRRGLDRNTNREIRMQHIASNAETGARLDELQEVLPALSRDQVRTLVRELQRAGRIQVRGTTKAARWFPSA
jgi:ATP-dependent DNA helicase RecG